jgi:hypothetical protein
VPFNPDTNFLTLPTNCHRCYGAPGEAFGRLYIRLWKMVNGQGFTVLGHTGGDVLRYRRGAIDRAVENCKLLVGDSNCVRWGFTDWDLGGMSGGPLLDHDGAVRGIHIASNLWLPDDEKLAFRMDAAARWSNDIRQIVRDQSPRVLGLLPGHSLARLRVRAREWEAETQAWGRVCATPVPASALDADGLPIDPTDHERWPSGWSIFSVDAEFQHVLHLRTSDDGGEVIPDVVHEDVTVLNGLCRLARPGIIHAWYSIDPDDLSAPPARHVVVATEDGARSTLWHVVRNARGLWSKHRIDTLDDLRWPSAGTTSFVTASRTVYLGGTHRRVDVNVPVPWIFVAAGPLVIGYSMTRDGRWLRVLTSELRQQPLHRVEAMTAWWGDAFGGNPGVSLCFVSRNAWRSKTVSHHHIANGIAYPLRGPERPPGGDGPVRVSRTLGLTGADSNTGGDLLWHVELEDGTVALWAYERQLNGTWRHVGDLCDERRADPVPRVREGRVRMQRGPQWLDDNGYRQFAWLTLDDGQLGRLWYRHGEWHYQSLAIHHAGERDPERSRRARRPFAPVFLFDGRTVPYRHWQAPGGSLLFVAKEDELLWSAFSGVAEDSLLHTRIDGNSVRLRCVTGASGLPIGWTYIPREDARPLLRGNTPAVRAARGTRSRRAGASATARRACATPAAPIRAPARRAPCPADSAS